MTIQFLCPNGHKIQCDAQRAGMAAKCPKCGEKFRIPTLEELEPAGATEEASAPSDAAEGGPGHGPEAFPGVGRGPAVAADQIEFLCPNNHLVHAPAELQGKPGQCPECGSRFRVPSYDEIAAETGRLESEVEGSQPKGSMEAVEDMSQFEEPSGGAAGADLGALAASRQSGQPAHPGQAAGPHPFFALFCQLWSHKAQGATVELRYGEGQRLVPDRFGKGLSGGAHAVFAVDEPNGTHVLTAIPWDSIVAVVIRGAKSLPKEMEA